MEHLEEHCSLYEASFAVAYLWLEEWGGGGWGFFFQAEDGIRDTSVTGVQTCALPIFFGLKG